MTDETTDIQYNDADSVADHTGGTQDAAPEVKAPEAPVKPEVAPAPAQAPVTDATRIPEEDPPEMDAFDDAAAEFVEEPVVLLPGQTLGALRGVAAGPADHPRTVRHHKSV